MRLIGNKRKTFLPKNILPHEILLIKAPICRYSLASCLKFKVNVVDIISQETLIISI
jgi:hypothetical protein